MQNAGLFTIVKTLYNSVKGSPCYFGFTLQPDSVEPSLLLGPTFEMGRTLGMGSTLGMGPTLRMRPPPGMGYCYTMTAVPEQTA